MFAIPFDGNLQANTKAKLNQVEMFEISRLWVTICWLKFTTSFAKSLSHTKVKNVHLYGLVTHMVLRLS